MYNHSALAFTPGVGCHPCAWLALQDLVREHMPSMLQTDLGNQREFFVSIVNPPHVRKLRELRMRDVGQLVAFSGTVTRSTEVRLAAADRHALHATM